MKKESSYHHILKYTGLFGGVQGLSILVGIVRNKVIAWLLGSYGVGLISIFNTASSLLHNATNFGLEMSGVREISQAFDAKDEAETLHRVSLLRSWSAMTAILGAVVTLLTCQAFSLWAFSNSNFTNHFAALSLVVAMMAITGGETAILKATRQLRQLAKISVMGVVAALIISVPLFYFWRYKAIVPSLILISFVQLILTTSYSYRLYPLHILKRWQEIRQGKKMISIGTAFVLAGVLGSGAEFAVRAYLSEASVAIAGLYNAGYMITMTYAGMIFAAMETDYYPHLSAVCHDREKMNGAVSRQIEVSLMMVAPMLVALMFGLKVLIPLLFTSKFLPVIGMAQITVMAMFLRAVDLPISYIMLAKGESKSYLLMEAVYDVLIIVTVIVGYSLYELQGTGVALAVTTVLHCLCVTLFTMNRYGMRLKWSLVLYLIIYIALGFASLLIVRNVEGLWYWAMSVVMVLLSAAVSWSLYKNRVKK